MLRLFVFCLCLMAVFIELGQAHQGHSEPYKNYLNQPKPDWLNVGKPIKVEAVEGGEAVFSKPDKKVVIFSKRVSLPEKNIEIKFDSRVRGGSSWGADGSSLLSPDGRMLVINAGSGSRMYEILGQGSYKEVEFDFPKVTFDSRTRGEIYGWRWASNGVLLAESEIENEDTGEHENNRVYAYHWREKILSRLDLEGLNLRSMEGVEIIDVSQDSKYLKINISDKVYTLKTDLESVPELLERDVVSRRSENSGSQQIDINPSSLSSNKSINADVEADQAPEKSSLPWIMAGVLFVGVLALLFKIFKCKSKS